MFAITNHNNESERIGCAQGFGFCAATHLDFALEQLHQANQGFHRNYISFINRILLAPVKSQSKLLSVFSKDKSDNITEASNTTVLCYGYISAYSAPS
jgi:hypothetical protein